MNCETTKGNSAERLVEMLSKRLEHAEVILDRLASGFWVCTLDQNSDGEHAMGQEVLQYWMRWSKGSWGDKFHAECEKAGFDPYECEFNAKDKGQSKAASSSSNG